MAKTVYGLGWMGVFEEPNGSFCVSEATAPGSYLPVPAAHGSVSWTFGQDILNPETLQQYRHAMPLQVMGARRGSTLSFKLPLGLTGTLATAAQATLTRASSATLLLLDMAFGGMAASAQGSVLSTVTSASSFSVAAGDGSQFPAGTALGILTDAGAMEIREVEAVATDAITLKHALSETPDVADVCYRAASFYLAAKASPTSCQFLVEREEADDYWVLKGCMPSKISFDLEYGSIPSMTMDFQVADWAYLGSGSLTAATYSNYTPLAYNSGELLIQTVSTATRAIVSHRSCTIETTLSYLPVPSVEGTNGIIEYIQNHAQPVATAKVGTYYEDQGYYTARAARTKKHVALQMGMSSAGGILITLPTTQITDISAPLDGDGLTGSDVTFISMLDEDTGGQTTEILRSPLRLHIVG